MSWLTPGLGLLAAAVAVPALLILYFLKLKRRELEVSTTLLWKQAIEDLRANAPFQRLRRNILLLLQLLALAALLVALAQPELAASAAPGQRHVILIDRSASMQTREEGGTTRLDLAKEDAKAFVRALREPTLLQSLSRTFGDRAGADEAMVIAFDAEAQVVQPFTASKARLLSAIDSITPTDAGTRLHEAMRLAGAYAQPVVVEDVGLVTPSTAPIVVWSDGRAADLAEIEPNPETPIVFHRVGSDGVVNIGVTALRAERAFDEPSRVSIFVGLQSTAPERRTADVELAINGVVSAVREATLPGVDEGGRPGVSGVVFETEMPAGGVARVRVVAEDALSADDAGWVVVPPPRRASVALVTRGSLYLQLALEGLNLQQLTVMTPAQFDAAAERGETGRFDVVVLDGHAPGTLPPGRYLALGVVPEIAGTRASAEAAPAVIVEYARDHAALRSAGLDRVYIAETRAIELGRGGVSLAESDRGPLIASVARGGVEAMIVAFDPARTDWPFDVGFVIFLAEAIKTLSGAERGSVESVAPGEAASVRLPAGATDVVLLDPQRVETGLEPESDGRVVFGPLRRGGLYTIRWRGEAGVTDQRLVEGLAQRAVAVNLLDPQESDARAADALELGSRTVLATAGASETATRRRLAPWLLLGFLGVLLVEWWVYNRKTFV